MSSSIPAAEYPIVIQEGVRFILDFTWLIDDVGVDMDGWTGLFQVRKRPNTTALITARTTPDAGEGTLTLDANGRCVITCEPEILESLDFQSGAYDTKFIDPSGVPYRKLQGFVTYSRAISDEEDES